MTGLLILAVLGLLPPAVVCAADEVAGSAVSRSKHRKALRSSNRGKPVSSAEPVPAASSPSANLITDLVKKAELEAVQRDSALREVLAKRADPVMPPGTNLPDNEWKIEVVGVDPQESRGKERRRLAVEKEQKVLGGKPAAVIGEGIEIVGQTGVVSRSPEPVVAVTGPVSSVSPVLTTSTESPDSLVDVVAVGDDARFHCTGIAIAPRAVLTARHCLPATRVLFGNDVAHPIALRAVFGSVAGTGATDVAVLWLASPVEVRLRRWHAAQDGAPALLGRIAGFGANDSGATRGAGEKRAARIPLQGWGCDVSRARTVGCQPGQELVVATPGGVDTCDGDSGGPLFERVSGEWRLLGITSRPIASSRKRCGDGGIYTRVDTVTDWVRGVLRAGPQKAQP